jgi:hypothetical protein
VKELLLAGIRPCIQTPVPIIIIIIIIIFKKRERLKVSESPV